MKIKETEITEALLDQITERIVNKEEIIHLDENDVCNVLVGKSGTMYEAYHEGKEHSDFMKSFFSELLVKSQVKNCTNVLISIEMNGDDPLVMEDMSFIDKFIERFSDETETIWGVSTNSSNDVMTLLVICTK